MAHRFQGVDIGLVTIENHASLLPVSLANQLAAAQGAYYNVLINLDGMTGDEGWVSGTRREADSALAEAERRAAEVREFVLQRLRR